MASKKVTITVPEEQLEELRSLVKAGQSTSVSAFVQHAISVALDDLSGWAAMLDIALDESGGPLTKSERDWADAILLDPDAA